MNFKTKKGIYKIWQVDRVNVYAYNVETKAELIIDIMDFNKWVDKGQVQMM